MAQRRGTTTSATVHRLTTSLLAVTAAGTLGAGVAMSHGGQHASATTTSTAATVLSTAAEDVTATSAVSPGYQRVPAPVSTRSS